MKTPKKIPQKTSKETSQKISGGHRSADVRHAFVDFFTRNGHAHISSAPLIPHDPSLLFTNAGMVQFKHIFSGEEKAKVKRAVTVQKCLRAGGKHNDLDNVGYTARHHTFFEMLGNFSFADYFKEEAISYAWEFLTDRLGLARDRLLITVYDGDDDTAALWKSIAGKEAIPIKGDDNFWAMGETGPCGPCTEIFYDHGDSLSGEKPPGDGGNRYVEIWNLVFMQYQRDEKGQLRDLDRCGVDTGMGLERICALMQGQHNNYYSDLFVPLIDQCCDTLGIQNPGSPSAENGRDPATLASLRVIADHFRASFCLIRSGLYPANSGRGYVLRRIMRRALRHVHKLTDGKADGRLWSALEQRLCATMRDQWEGEFTDDTDHEVSTLLMREQEYFYSTLGRGLKLLNKACETLDKGAMLSGEVAFTLYDTYGFPLDLTEDILRTRGHQVDNVGFDKAMHIQKKKARAAWVGSGDGNDDPGMGKLLDELSPGVFTGYDDGADQFPDKAPDQFTDEAPDPFNDHGTDPFPDQAPDPFNDHFTDHAKVDAILVDGLSVDKASTGTVIAFVCDRSPFYARSGGQLGDRGRAVWTKRDKDRNKNRDKDYGKDSDKECKALDKDDTIDGYLDISDTVKSGDFHIHIATLRKGELRRGQDIQLFIDRHYRRALCANHSATHLFHAALRKRLGHHVSQKGSLVADDHLRFDISHPKPISDADLYAVEDAVNRRIIANRPVRTRVMDYQEALGKGATALFSERYADKVRVVSMGGMDGDRPYSIELCGGTHVRHSGDIGAFAITGQSAVGAGIRRLEAKTGVAAIAFWRDRSTILSDCARALKTSAAKISGPLQSLIEEKKRADKAVFHWRKRAAVNEILAKKQDIDTISYAAAVIHDLPGRDNKDIVMAAAELLPRAVIALVGSHDGKASIVIRVPPPYRPALDAVTLIRGAADILGGKGGGGSPTMAQAGGPDVRNATKALDRIAAMVEAAAKTLKKGDTP